MKFGSHVSIREGYLGAAKQAAAMSAAAFQYFPKNPRSLSVKAFNQEDARVCREFCIEKGIVSVSHTPYPTSLTPANDEKRKQVVESLLNDLEITDACGSVGVVVHFGKRSDDGDPLVSYQLMIAVLNDVLSQWDGGCKILLENNAGKPGSMGTTLEELVQVRTLCDQPEKIGFCLDTCHAFASGLWNGDNWNEVLNKGLELDYFNYLEVIHFNNSKYDTGSGKDRHANILGEDGYITAEQFDQLITTPLVADIPFILETPKETPTHEAELKQLQRKWGTE